MTDISFFIESIYIEDLADNDNVDNPKIVAKIEKAMEAKTALKLISRILAT